MRKPDTIFCCERMTYFLDEYFKTPQEQDNPDVVVKYNPIFDEYGIPVYEGGSSVIVIQYCPWCGTKLPASKRDLWFETLENKELIRQTKRVFQRFTKPKNGIGKHT